MKKKLDARAFEFRVAVLALLAYRLYSETFVAALEKEEYQARKFQRAIAAYDYSLKYSSLRDEEIDASYVQYMRERLGYFLMPSQLYSTALAKAKKNLRRFMSGGERVTLDEAIRRLFRIVEARESEPLFESWFVNPERFGEKLRDRSVYLANKLLFVDAMNYDVVEQTLDLLA